MAALTRWRKSCHLNLPAPAGFSTSRHKYKLRYHKLRHQSSTEPFHEGNSIEKLRQTRFRLNAECHLIALDAIRQRQEEAEALLARARELSDMRCEGCPPFRLAAGVEVLGSLNESVEGTCSLVWALLAKWREEVEFPVFRKVRVGLAGKVRISRSRQAIPLRVHQVLETWEVRPRLRLATEERVSRVWKQKARRILWSCTELVSKLEPRRELCFSPEGLLTREEIHGAIEVRREYDDFAVFRGVFVPVTMRQ